MSRLEKRMNKELADYNKAPLEGVSVAVDCDNSAIWKVMMEGPVGTPYLGGKFQIDIDF